MFVKESPGRKKKKFSLPHVSPAPEDSANFMLGITHLVRTQNVSKSEHCLPPDTLTQLCVSWWQKMLVARTIWHTYLMGDPQVKPFHFKLNLMVEKLKRRR